MRDRSRYDGMKKGSDEIGCTSEIMYHKNGIIEIDDYLFKGEGRRFSREDVTKFMLQWNKFLDKEPITLSDALDKMESDEPMVDYDYAEDPCDFDGECLSERINAQADHKECEDITLFDGERVTVCKYYKQPWVTLYNVSREYGGPEEGGWYYDSGSPKLHVPVFSEEDVKYVTKMLENMDYRCFDKMRIDWCCHKGEHYPKHRPHYS